MQFNNLLVAEEDGITTVTFGRPEVRNALDVATWEEISALIEELGRNEDTQVVIFTGAGDEAFAAGSDIGWLRDRSMLATLDAFSQKVLARLEALPQPTLAAINGYALGGGCELAMACDIRIASESAQLGQPEVRLGILPGAGGTQRLPRLVGIAKAKELILTGEIIDAATAERIGLVNHVVPADELMEATKALARKIMQRGPVAVRLAKMAINASLDVGSDVGFVCEQLAQTVLFGTDDRVEGLSAFLEKRRPEFEGR